ncbi:MAG: zinc-binding dehydrogenase, partial [Candidatus Poribacteria bacterium]|nr:zinc-binding dehydrogenase [Candidatus Poribacteria bacterium]
MKIAILHGPRDLRIEEQPLDTDNLKSDEIWIETEISALKIGTDRGNYEGAERVPGAPDYPRWVGDSNLGVVRGVGSAVTQVQVGARVVTRQPHQSEYITDESASIIKVPEGVHPEDAVYTHLYALSSHCYRKAHFQPGENVAVVGLGVLGLGAVALGPLFGARVVGIGNSPIRLEMAERMGAHAAYMSDDPDLEAKLDAVTNGTGIDLVILTANPWPAYRTSLQIVRPNGRVSIVSLPGRGEPPL